MIPIIKVALKFGRGALKAVAPGITQIIETIRNRKGVKMEVVTETGDKVTGIAKPHDPVSMAGGYIMAAVMIYLVVSGKLPIEKAHDLANLVLNFL